MDAGDHVNKYSATYNYCYKGIQGVYTSCTPYHEETGADSQSCHQGLAIFEEYQTFQKDKRQYIR